MKYIPPVLHNNDVYLTVIYKCSSLRYRRISLSIHVERTLHQRNFVVLRHRWLCYKSTQIKIRYIRIHLHRSVAYASDTESNFQSLPIEQGQLKLIMYKSERENDNEILKKVQYKVEFLPVHKRPSFRSFRWTPLTIYKTADPTCSREPGKILIVPVYIRLNTNFDYLNRNSTNNQLSNSINW